MDNARINSYYYFGRTIEVRLNTQMTLSKFALLIGSIVKKYFGKKGRYLELHPVSQSLSWARSYINIALDWDHSLDAFLISAEDRDQETNIFFITGIKATRGQFLQLLLAIKGASKIKKPLPCNL